MTTQEIENEIKSAIKAIPSLSEFPNEGRNPKWTKAIRLAIGKLGENLGYEVCGLPFQEGWLFDLCWFSTTDTSDQKLLNMTLAMESELNKKYSEIKYDFEKLLIAKSKFKILVFQAKGQTITDYFKKVEQSIRTYQSGSSGEIYLLACYDYENEEFEIKRIEGA